MIDKMGQTRNTTCELAAPSRLLAKVSDAGNLGQGALATYGERLTITVTSLLLSVLLVRFLTTDDFGIYKLALGAVTITTYLASFGLEAIVCRFVPELLATRSHRTVLKLIGLTALLRTATLLCFLPLLYSFRQPIGTLFNATRLFEEHYIILAGLIALYLLTQLLGPALLVGHSERHIAAYVRIGNDLLLLAGLGLGLLYGYKIRGVLLIMLGVSAVQFITYIFLALPKVATYISSPRLSQSSSEHPSAASIIKFGIYNYFWQGGQVFREFTVDNYVISAVRSVTEVAYYSVAAILPTLLYAFTPGRVLYGVILPELSRRFTLSNSHAELDEWYRFLQKLNILVLTPFLLIFLFFTPEVIASIYGEAYTASSQPARILVAFSLITALTSPFYLIAQVVKRPQILFYSSIWGLYNLAMDLLLIPAYGISGAAWATGTTSIFLFLHFYIGFRYFLKVPILFPLKAIRITILNSTPLTLCLLLAKYVGVLNPFTLVLLGVGAVSYFGMNYLNTIFNGREQQAIHRRLGIRPVFT